MSAPKPVPRSRLTPRLLSAVAFVVVGFVLVWQGFGVVGYGTDVHALRVIAACAPLFVAGLVIAWPKMWPPMRIFSGLFALGIAIAMWWVVPHLPPMDTSAMSLRDAAEVRDSWKPTFANPSLESLPRNPLSHRIQIIFRAYPSLTKELRDDYARWTEGVTDAVVARYDQIPSDDPKSAVSLREAAEHLAELEPASGERIERAFRSWLARTVAAKQTELKETGAGDWAAFDRTAPCRKALAETFPDTRDALVRAEEEWGERTVEWFIHPGTTHDAEKDQRFPTDWRAYEADFLAADALDKGAGRFKAARRRLFGVAHADVKRRVTAHLEANRYDAAFGLARKHAVDWNATAAVLGADEVQKLVAFRDHCESLAKLHEVSAKPPPVAPPPREVKPRDADPKP